MDIEPLFLLFILDDFRASANSLLANFDAFLDSFRRFIASFHF